jgi:hypothetical protein
LTNAHFFSLTETTGDDVIDTNILENEVNDRCASQSDDNPTFMFGNRAFLGNISRSGSHDNSGLRLTNHNTEHWGILDQHLFSCHNIHLTTIHFQNYLIKQTYRRINLVSQAQVPPTETRGSLRQRQMNISANVLISSWSVQCCDWLIFPIITVKKNHQKKTLF